MGVTITLGEVALELRISVTDDVAAVPAHYVELITRAIADATELINRSAPNAADGIANRAAILLIAYWFDADPSENRRQRSAWYMSGAAETLSPWIERRAEAV